MCYICYNKQLINMSKRNTNSLKGLPIGQITQDMVLVPDGAAFAMRHDKYKVAKLEDTYTVEKINPTYTRGCIYILLRDSNNTPFSLIGEPDTFSGLTLKN